MPINKSVPYTCEPPTTRGPDDSPRLPTDADGSGIWGISRISGLEMLEASGEAALILDRSGTIVFCNTASERLQRRSRSEIIGKPLGHVSSADRPVDETSDVWRQLIAGQHWSGDIWVQCGDGSRVPVCVTRSPLFGGDGTVVGVLSLATDRTREQEAEQALKGSEQRLRALAERFGRVFDESPVGKMIVGTDLRIVEVNQALCDCLGYPPEYLKGASMDLFVEPSHAADHRSRWEQLFAGDVDRLRAHLRCIRSDGTELVARVSAAVLHDDAGIAQAGICEVEDVTEQFLADEELARRALTDPLTSLPNRALLADRLGRALTRVSREPALVAVMFLDVDRFKDVNDAHGHDAGDRLLVAVGERLSAQVRATDTVARFGGDEFVVVFEGVADAEQVLAFGERLVRVVAAPLDLDGEIVTPTVSIGAALATDASASPSSLVRDADIAMYTAKDRGGDCCVLYEIGMRPGPGGLAASGRA